MKALLFAIIMFASAGYCQQKETYPSTTKALEARIIALDKEAFECYNTCNLEKFRTFFTEDLEFYHDKGGIIQTAAKLIETMKTGLCSNPHLTSKRKAVEGTLKVYPLDGYGAVLTGDHEFYESQDGKEQKTGIAKFTHIWLLKDGIWKMSRVLSYDHKAAQ